MKRLQEAAAGFDEAVAIEVGRLPASIGAFAGHALTGGKRVRPRVVRAFATACGNATEDALRFAVAVEFIHKASLIQDDLPCMDSDSVRNGRPTLHVVCSPAEAVLVSDVLIAHAFRVCAESATPAEAVGILSEAVLSLAAGQAADLAGTVTRSDSDWRAVSDAKTGALFSASAHLGVLASGQPSEWLQTVAGQFGRSLGRVYQWYDDMRDGDAGHLSPSLVEPELRAIRDALIELPDAEPVAKLLDHLVSSIAPSSRDAFAPAVSLESIRPTPQIIKEQRRDAQLEPLNNSPRHRQL
jgi:geranylgeranyl pyrophosphate synthase